MVGASGDLLYRVSRGEKHAEEQELIKLLRKDRSCQRLAQYLDVKDRRAGVIGIGAVGVQLIEAIACQISHRYVYQ